MNARMIGAAVTVGALMVALSTPAGLGGSARANGGGASFDCAKAASPAERAICADPGLAALDGAMGGAYSRRLARDPGVLQVQRAWLHARDAGCGKDSACLKRLIGAQLAWLNGAAAMPQAMPKREGACSVTRVQAVGSRLEGDPESGSAVTFANDVDEVGYSAIPAVQAWRVGDAALVCLIALPEDCPPNDDRGKTYVGVDLRTLGAWSAADSEHMCGGA